VNLPKSFPPEGRQFEDPRTGARIRQLTDWRAHSYHLYFTHLDRWDDGRRMLIGSERHNAPNLYSVELDSGELTRLTDFGPHDEPGLITAFANPRRDEAYLTLNGAKLLAVDLPKARTRVLYTAPDGYRLAMHSCTADGQTVCIATNQDLAGRIRMDLGHGYIGFREYWAARPHCQIVAVPVDGGPARVVHEEDRWLTHVNTSPTLPNVLTFCHEGPWEVVEQRMWALELSSGTARPLRPQESGEAIGHEYWFADGERVGYHGRVAGRGPRYGWVRYDGSDGVEYDFPAGSTHFHSRDETLIVGDGSRTEPRLLLWRLGPDGYEPPRVLAEHRGSFHTQVLHVHPRLVQDADGELRVVYTADTNGYGNVFIADVGDVGALPAAS